MPIFKLKIPKIIQQVPDKILQPWTSWNSESEYTADLKHLANLFINNFGKYNITDIALEGGPIICEKNKFYLMNLSLL